MQFKTLAIRLALAGAFTLSAAALAGETTDIEIAAGGVVEKISLDDLAVGETRQLYSDTGTLVTATRTADELVLDIGGEKTTLPMPAAGELSDEAIEALLAAHGADGDGKHHVVRIQRVEGDGAPADGERRVIVLGGKDGELHALPGDGKQVIVKRTVKKDAQP